MKVCFLINQLAPGGAPTLLLDIVRYTDSDIDYTVCFIEGDDLLVPDFEAAGARVVDFGAEFKFDPRALYRMVRFFRREDFDLLHAHLPYAQTLGRLVGKVSVDGPIVSTQHSFPEQYHPITRVLERITRPFDDATIAVSQAVERSFTDTATGHIYPDRSGKWCTIYNGVNVEKMNDTINDSDTQSIHRRWNLDSGPVFLSVGRYQPVKDQKTLIRAMQNVRQELPGATLLVVGWGPLEEELKQLVRDLNLEGTVIITGRAKPIEPYYAVADAFVLSSLTESFGIVFIEAMAAELPIVATDIPVIKEIITDGETGIVVSPNDSTQLANAMMQLGDPKLRRRFGRRSYMRVAKQFDISRTIRSHINLYRNLYNYREKNE